MTTTTCTTITDLQQTVAGYVSRRIDEIVEAEDMTGLLRGLVGDCERVAREHGYDGDDYEPTREDMRWIVERVQAECRRAPTRDEWASAGLAWVGSEHVSCE